MTNSEEESLYKSLLGQLRSPEPAEVLAALVSIKHRVIGHDQTKELFVRLGIVDSLVSILNSNAIAQDQVRQDVKVEAGIVVGSLAYGTHFLAFCCTSRGMEDRSSVFALAASDSCQCPNITSHECLLDARDFTGGKGRMLTDRVQPCYRRRIIHPASLAISRTLSSYSIVES
jgi:hypothetical protein